METVNDRKTFWGSSSNNVCAFCKKHRLFLTPHQMRKRGCMGHECSALKRLEHPVWEKQKQKREVRKNRKLMLEQRYLNAVGKGEAQIESAL